MILCYGSINPDLVHRLAALPRAGDDISASEFAVTYGGGAANAAVCLAAWGGVARLAGNSIGADPLAAWLLEDLADRGIDVSLITQDPGSATPHVVVLVTPDGERTMVGSGYADVFWQEIPIRALDDVDAVLVDAYAGLAGVGVLKAAFGRGIPSVALDVITTVADIVVLSRHHQSEEAATELAASGPSVILTAGAAPVAVFTERGRWSLTPPPVSRTVAVGAGDAFGAMCALGVASGWKLRKTVAMAAAAASLSASADRGAAPPDMRQIQSKAKSLLT